MSNTADKRTGRAIASGIRRGSWVLCLLVLGVFSLGADSCQNSSLGPGEVGSATCLACHDGRSASNHLEFLDSPHQGLSCESCHGPGLTHVQQGGRLGLFIDNPNRYPFDTRHTACITCHSDIVSPVGIGAQGFLATNHFLEGAATCTDCHDVHKQGGMLISSTSPARFGNANYATLCGSCHVDQVEQFSLSGHAQKDVATCSSCHDMHAGDMFRADPTTNRLCLQCHQSFALGFQRDVDVDFHTGDMHPVDPAGSGSSRCTGCHLPPNAGSSAVQPSHDHTLFTIPPIASNDAVAMGVEPAPPNSCAGVTGCHDPVQPNSGPPYDENDLESNTRLQSLYEIIGARP